MLSGRVHFFVATFCADALSPFLVEMSLERFKAAQENHHAGYVAALDEILRGRKTGHWIWYIFPQLIGLGSSATARAYALKDIDEACEYLRDSVLRFRLQVAAEAVGRGLARGIRLADLMGGHLDALKLVSSLTLFELAARRLAEIDEDSKYAGLRDCFEKILSIAADQGFVRCEYTQRQCSGKSSGKTF